MQNEEYKLKLNTDFKFIHFSDTMYNIFYITENRFSKNKIAKKFILEKEFWIEFNTLKKLKDCDFVPKIISIYTDHDENCKYLIMKLLPGVELFNYCNKSYKSEDFVKNIIFQLLNYVKILHDRNIIHGDLKLENIIYDEKTNKIYLIDFNNKTTYTYISPEVKSNFNFKGKEHDIWCIGVLCYVMLEQKFPYGDNRIIFNKIFTRSDISIGCMMFIYSCLRSNPCDRPVIDDLINDFWFTETI